MFLAAQRTHAGRPPTSIDTRAAAHLGEGPTVTTIELPTVAVVPGVSQQPFDETFEFSKTCCPICKVIASLPRLKLTATLT